MIKSYAMMTVYQLRMECKRLKIRGYSKLRKKELRELVENHARKEQVKEIQKDEDIFCYPEILKEIYSYVDMDNTNEERKKLLKNLESETLKLNRYREIYSKKKLREKRQYLNKIGLKNLWQLKNKIEQYGYMSYDLKLLMKSRKNILYLWLKGLEYKVKKDMKKKEMKELVEKYYKELNE